MFTDLIYQVRSRVMFSMTSIGTTSGVALSWSLKRRQVLGTSVLASLSGAGAHNTLKHHEPSIYIAGEENERSTREGSTF